VPRLSSFFYDNPEDDSQQNKQQSHYQGHTPNPSWATPAADFALIVTSERFSFREPTGEVKQY
jgi:hypothetical protein